jgi:hypothetical protein
MLQVSIIFISIVLFVPMAVIFIEGLPVVGRGRGKSFQGGEMFPGSIGQGGRQVTVVIVVPQGNFCREKTKQFSSVKM